MKSPRRSCPHEDAVAAAARAGAWSEELRAHRDGCLSCAELTLVVAALAADAEDLESDPRPLPDPSVIWLRARLAERQNRVREATRSIVWVQRAAVAVAVAVGVFIAPDLWRIVSDAALSLLGSSSMAQLPRAAGSPALVLVISMVVLGGLALWELTTAPGS